MTPELTKRLKTAGMLIVAVSALLVLAQFLWWGKIAAAIAAWLLVACATFEYLKFSTSTYSTSLRVLSLTGVFLLPPTLMLATVSAACFQQGQWPLVWWYSGSVFVGTVLLSIIGVLFGRSDVAVLKIEIPSVVPAFIHISAGGAALVGMACFPAALFWGIAVVCVGDSSAYFSGKALGGPKLAPAISPNKTVSGALANLVGCVIAGTLLGQLTFEIMSVQMCALLALSVSVIGQTGDLWKSYLKRLHEVKDSGSILPGHGGIYDRIDAVLAVSFLIFSLQAF